MEFYIKVAFITNIREQAIVVVEYLTQMRYALVAYGTLMCISSSCLEQKEQICLFYTTFPMFIVQHAYFSMFVKI